MDHQLSEKIPQSFPLSLGQEAFLLNAFWLSPANSYADRQRTVLRTVFEREARSNYTGMQNKNDEVIRITEHFPVGKEVLYQAWTEADRLKQWWKPMNRELEEVQTDLRPGGNLQYRFSGGLVIDGEYKEVHERNRLVYSWIWNLPEDSVHQGDYLLTVGFTGDEQHSTLDVTQENFEAEQAIKPHQDGWQQALNDLKEYLQKTPL